MFKNQSLFKISTLRVFRNLFTKEKLPEVSTVPEFNEDEESVKKEAEIQKSRNKSRLEPHHYNIMHNKKPYKEPQSWVHQTLRYQRTMYGRFGSNSGVNPAMCWPTETELADKLEYEKVAFPYTILEVMEENEENKREKKRLQLERQEEIVKKVAKLGQWKKDLADRMAKKEELAMKAKEKKDRLVEEVRRHFGFKVDPKDDRFKQMLEQKEKEEKKLQKEAKKKAKEAKFIQILTEESMKTQENSPDKNKISNDKKD